MRNRGPRGRRTALFARGRTGRLAGPGGSVDVPTAAIDGVSALGHDSVWATHAATFALLLLDGAAGTAALARLLFFCRGLAAYLHRKAAATFLGVDLGGWLADRDQAAQGSKRPKHPAPVTDASESLGNGIESFRVHVNPFSTCRSAPVTTLAAIGTHAPCNPAGRWLLRKALHTGAGSHMNAARIAQAFIAQSRLPAMQKPALTA
jgi:hypothetical protein